MIIETVSGIQIATLVVAGLAVGASILGIFWTPRSSQRSEHKIWQRNLQERLYGECTARADQTLRVIEEIISIELSHISEYKKPEETAKRELQLEDMYFERLRALETGVASVDTFGPVSVKASAVAMLKAFNETTYVVGIPDITIKDMQSAAQKAKDALSEFRSAVRKSLGIDN